MSWVISVYIIIQEALRTGWARLVRGVASITRRQKPCAASIPVPVSAAIVKTEEFFNAPVHTSPQTLDDCFIARCPSARTPPTQQPCRSADVRRGSHAARALFHGAFKAPALMGVYQITSNAFSSVPPDPFSPLYVTESTPSPSTTSEGESQFSPTFDHDSPRSPSSVSTAPTTPPTLFSSTITKCSIQTGASTGWESDDDVPLFTLKIRGPSDTAKRHDLPVAISPTKGDESSWISGLEASCTNATSRGVLPFKESSFVDRGQSDNSLNPPIASLNHSPSSADPSRGDLPPTDNPESTTDWWGVHKHLLDADEVSVYSLESYLPATQNVNSPHDSHHPDQVDAQTSVPEIILTPPSLPTSPEMLSCATGDGALAPLHSVLEGLDDDNETTLGDDAFFKPTHLLVPASDFMARDTQSYSYLDNVSPDSDHDISLKKRRRNACRMETSSIDLIMASLDQVFPASPSTPNVTSDNQKDDEVDVTPHTSQDIAEVNIGVYVPKSHTDVTSVFPDPMCPQLPDEIDISGTTLLEDEKSLESKFSDSSDDDNDGSDSDFPYSPSHPDVRSLISWPLYRGSIFDPSSALTPIVEEEESDDFASLGRPCCPSRVLQPSAIIKNPKLSPTPSSVTAFSLTKRRWFSMIEGQAKARSGKQAVEQTRHRSAPAPVHLGTSRLVSSAINPSGGRLDLLVEKRLLSAITNSHVRRPKPSVRPLILPAAFAPNYSGVSVVDSGTPVSSLDARNRVRTFAGVVTSDELLPWTLYQAQSQSINPPCSSSVSSVHSEMSVTTSGSSPNTPDTMVEESELAKSNVEIECQPDELCTDGDEECDLLLHTVASNPQGLNGILAILDAFEMDMPNLNGYRPTSYPSIASSQVENDERWSNADLDGCPPDYDGTFIAGIAV